MTFGELLKAARLKNGYTQKQLADLIGAKHNSISNWENDQNKPDPETLEYLCGALEVSANYFFPSVQRDGAWSSQEEIIIKKYRDLDSHGKKMVDFVIDTETERMTEQSGEVSQNDNVLYVDLARYSTPVSAGIGADLLNETPEIIDVVKNIYTKQADFILRVRGNSMEPKFYNDDIILVQEAPEVEIGEIGIYIINELGYVKEYRGDRLRSLNEKYEDIYFGEFDNIRCVGRVVGKLDPAWVKKD